MRLKISQIYNRAQQGVWWCSDILHNANELLYDIIMQTIVVRYNRYQNTHILRIVDC